MKITYLIQTFPSASETFIFDEIASHIRHGLDISVVALTTGDMTRGMTGNESLISERHLALNLSPNIPGRIFQTGVACLNGMARRQHRRLLEILNPLDARFAVSRHTIINLAVAWNRLALKPDILHCHYGPVGLYGCALKSLGLTTARIVTTFHGYDMSIVPSGRRRNVYAPLFRHGDLFLPISDRWRQKLIFLGGDAGRIRLHRVGVEHEKIAFRERTRTGDEPVRIISVGRLVEKKGHSAALKALALLRSRRPDLSLSYDLVGDGPLSSHLRQEADRLGLAGTVTFHGSVCHDRVLEMLDHGMIFVLPSTTAANGDQEGIPVALMEAMAGGMPVVSTRHSGIPELVEDGVSGILCPEGDPQALSAAIEHMIADSPRWPEMGRAGRSRVEREFNQQRQHETLRAYYRELMEIGLGCPSAPERPVPATFGKSISAGTSAFQRNA